MSDLLDPRRKKALYRAQHRGTKEMDWLLGRFAEARIVAMSSAELDGFEQFLQIPDVDLHAWIVTPETIADRAFAGLVDAIRAFHKLDEAAR
jgi:antitoxin CptB